MYVARVVLHCDLYPEDLAADAQLFHGLSGFAVTWTNQAVDAGYRRTDLDEGFDDGFFLMPKVRVAPPHGRALKGAVLRFGVFDKDRGLALADFYCDGRGKELLKDLFSPQPPSDKKDDLKGYLVFSVNDPRTGSLVVLKGEFLRARHLPPNTRNTVLAQY